MGRNSDLFFWEKRLVVICVLWAYNSNYEQDKDHHHRIIII